MSESLDELRGIYLDKSSGPIITPQAWVPVLRMEPSSSLANLRVFFTSSLPFSIASLSSATCAKASSRVTPGLSGTSFASLSDSLRGSSNILATSLIALLAAMVPKVIT